LTENEDCINPLRSDESATAATPFFAPCQGMAWTYVNDNSANSFGDCQDGQVWCCIGMNCGASYKQSQSSASKRATKEIKRNGPLVEGVAELRRMKAEEARRSKAKARAEKLGAPGAARQEGLADKPARRSVRR